MIRSGPCSGATARKSTSTVEAKLAVSSLSTASANPAAYPSHLATTYAIRPASTCCMTSAHTPARRRHVPDGSHRAPLRSTRKSSKDSSAPRRRSTPGEATNQLPVVAVVKPHP
jgi:hypothetical protein